MQYPQIQDTVQSTRFPPNLLKSSKEEIKEYFINSFSLMDTLFKTIKSEESFRIVPDPLRRPIMWYLGHTAALYINKFETFGQLQDYIVDEKLEKFFKTGVDPILSSELDNEIYIQNLPAVSEVWKYRQEVFQKVLQIIDQNELTLPIAEDSLFYTILLGCEHERIHYETSICLFRQMPVNTLQKPQNWKYSKADTQNYPSNEMITVKGQSIRLGKDRDFPTYGWDNEYGELNFDVKDFRASKFLISNGEYLEFVRSGAYNEQKNWESEGWEWKQRENVQHPLFWVPQQGQEGQFKYRTVFEEINMPLNWPVDISYHEAMAYCQWKGKNFRPIKEGEFNLIRGEHLNQNYGTNELSRDVGAYGQNQGNINLQYGSSAPVDDSRPSQLGFHDVYGNVWEWSADLFKPLPGFKTHYLYEDYSGGCFDAYHNLMLGGCWATTGLNASSFFRVAFRRHFYQNCGFRLVEEIEDDDQQAMYTDKVYLNRYLHFNFATNEEFLPIKSQIFDLTKYESFPVKIAQEAIKYYKQVKLQLNPDNKDIFKNTHAFDLGCGMGRTAFELARDFSQVTALDYAHGFIDVAQELKEKGEMKYTYLKTGDIYEEGVAKIAPEIERERINFIQGDAMNLKCTLKGPFDLVIASNLIDRLYNPMQCLADMCPLIAHDGILIILSPYTWMENVARKDKWVGGTNGETTFEALKRIMATLCFELVDEQTMTLLIKEHERKFEFIMPHMTIWRKRQFSQEFATSVFKQ